MEIDIENIVSSYIQQSLAGLSKEHYKFDFKKEWYDLTTEDGIMEFLKDTTSIVNTVGPDGFIVIGFDDESKTFHEAKFTDSNIDDTSKIADLINKKVDRLFPINVFDITIDGNKLSIIHLPPSLDKPHVIRIYRKNENERHHQIFVRHGTKTRVAGKYDLDLMYYDRKNIIPDFEVHCHCMQDEILLYSETNGRIYLRAPCVIENTGRRPIAIRSMRLSITLRWATAGDRAETYKMEYSSSLSTIIESGSIREVEFNFKALTNMQFGDLYDKYLMEEVRRGLEVSPLELILTNGEHLTTEFQIVAK